MRILDPELITVLIHLVSEFLTPAFRHGDIIWP